MENYQKSIKHCPDQDEIVLVRKIFQKYYYFTLHFKTLTSRKYLSLQNSIVKTLTGRKYQKNPHKYIFTAIIRYVIVCFDFHLNILIRQSINHSIKIDISQHSP